MNDAGKVPACVRARTCVAHPIRDTLLAVSIGAAALQPALALDPGRGAAAQYEKDYLTFVIDHHFSALRITELAAGTDRTRDAALQHPGEGTAPTPGYGATPAKSDDEQIRSLARQDNRVQREEIAKAQRLLHDWYGIQHAPVLLPEGRQEIERLEQAPAGAQFDQAFLRTFANHHFRILAPSLQCQVQSDLKHQVLHRYCENIVVAQKNQINDMRDMLCTRFKDCGFAPDGRVQEKE